MKTKAGMLRQSHEDEPERLNNLSEDMIRVVDCDKVITATRTLLEAIGENPDREGLVDTPRRVARAWKEFIEYEPGNIETAFQSITVDQMVIIRDMRVYSLCEHHLVPFFADISIGYITGEKVLGLSKFGRICHKFAHKLQLQERLVEEIAAELRRLLEHEDVAVVASGEHLCMSSRGIRTRATMVSSSMNGVFRTEESARSEFLRIAGFN